MELFVAIGVFGLVVGFFYLILSPKTLAHDEAVQQRLERIAAGGKTRTAGVRLLGDEGEETFWEHVADFFLGKDELPAKYMGFRSMLHQAGYPGERAIRIFWGVRIGLTGIFGAVAVVLAIFLQSPVSELLMLLAGFAGFGYLLPFIIVRQRSKARLIEMQETLPDTLDLLVICVEAGLAVDAAMVRVAKEQVEQELVIGEEWQLMTQEIQAGVPRREALSRMGDRVGLEDIRALVTFLTQTEDLGGSIARSLRVYASTMREKRSQRAEEAARKAVIKLIFPLVLFILPALFLVIMGPAMLNIVKLFSSAGG
ncbi:MAG: type II secretion system F family protein [Candidatus Binatia bacterium]